MTIITFTLILFILIWVLHHLNNRASRNEENLSKEFWNREHASNDVRKKDISMLPYIQISLEKLPLSDTSDPELLEYHETIRQLSEQKILNLSGLSNTDLKLQYGPSNLDTLMEYDSNYTTLIRTLSLWGKYLYDHGNLTDSQSVLEYGITCDTDIKNNYVLLARIYHDSNHTDKINDLISKAQTLDTLLKPSIISSLQTIQNS